MASTGAQAWRGRRGSTVTVATVAALLVGIAATLLGSGVPDNALAGFDASAWLWSSPKGELARVNGVTGRVDTRYRLTDGQGRSMQVSQTDRYVIMRDLGSGAISVLDLASLQVAATTQSAPGVGISVAVHDNAAFIVDGVQGLVRQLDPATLAPVGEPLRFPPGLTGGTFDAAGRLWLLVASEGTVAAITPSGDGSPNPKVLRSVPVTAPGHELALTVLDSGAAVLDSTSRELLVVAGDAATPRRIKLAMDGPGSIPPRTTGGSIAVTVPENRQLFVVTGDAVTEHAVPGSGTKLAPCTVWSNRFYCPDEATGTVQVIGPDGTAGAPITMPNPGGALDLEVREQHLFINAPGSSTANVVDAQGRVKVVDKYTNNIVGGDPPPAPPPVEPTKPVVAVPSAPGRVNAVAGNAQIRLTWTAAAPNGAPVQKYVVEGAGASVEVGANQRSLDVTRLTNGTEYRLTVHAVNAKGAGPKRAANPVVPTAEVPDAPVSVTATDKPDGTVAVTWPAANGQGRKVTRYEVTSVSRGATAPAGETDGTTLVIAAGKLTYGTQYAFTVVAVNDKGASSAASPVSNTVTPYTLPGAPRSLKAATVNKPGTVQVSWGAAEENGRAVKHYEVTAGNKKEQVKGLSATLDGLGDGAVVQVSVRAVNEAGEGPVAKTSAKTIEKPKITVTGSSAERNSITVNFSVADGGSAASCTLQISGGGSKSGNCSSLEAGGVWPGRGYNWTLTVTNAAGSASANGSNTTQTLRGTVLCNTPSYCGKGDSGSGVWTYSGSHQTEGNAVGRVYGGETFEAVCQKGDATSVNAKPWGGKQSNDWVRIKFPAGKESYVPFAWLRLDGGDNLNQLPGC